MKIALIGYGKMGQTIDRIAMQRGHTIVMRISSANRHEMTAAQLQYADVAIEFTRPESAREHVPEAKVAAITNNAAFLHASNFSIGVNIFFEINKLLARLMNGHHEYDATIEETHHLQKKDAPSGTAITLAEQIIENLDRKQNWSLTGNSPEDIYITAHRTEGVPGTHKITWSSAIDDIDIIHKAHNRDGFALGAVLAAEYIADKKGVFTMKDVLGMK
jgi:4-hydroxy-tetrahydrodipicolinate reductase